MVVAIIHKTTHAAAKQRVELRSKATLLSAGGPGAGGFLLYPTEPLCALEDVDWSTSLRRRLQLPRPECSLAELARASATCCNQTAGGATCAAPLDEDGYHACTCQSGGGVVRRHGDLEKTLGSLAGRWRHCAPLYEQRVPAWDRLRARRPAEGPGPPVLERAVLDLQYAEVDGPWWVDVTVRHPAAGDDAAVRAAARRTGEASRRAEREKHSRYPGDRLTAFAVEIGGRLGAEAREWLLAHVRELPEDAQPRELARAYQVISCAVQRRRALQLRRAAGLR